MVGPTETIAVAAVVGVGVGVAVGVGVGVAVGVGVGVTPELLVAPLSGLTCRELTLTGSKSDKVKFLKHERSVLFHLASGVPIKPPVWPLSARIMP